MIFLFCYFGFIVICWALFGKKENPYIKTHKRKWQNNTDYQEYLRWLDRQGGDVPLNKADFKEDFDVMNEVNKHINR